MEGPKDFETRLAMPAAAERKRRAAVCATGGHQPPQQPPHNCTLHPFFCTSGSINRAAQKQNKDQQLESCSCSHCGHAAQVLQLLSHLVFSLLSVLSTTTTLLHNSISFSCDWAKVSPHSCYLVKSFPLTTGSLPGCRFWLSQFTGNHCFTACCSGFLSAALLSRFSSSFLPNSGRQWSILASAVAWLSEMLSSLTERDTEIHCCVFKENSKPQNSLYLQRAPYLHPLVCSPTPPNWSCSSPLRVKDSFRSQCFQPRERRAEHAPVDMLLQEAGWDSPAAPQQLAFSSSLFSLCPRAVAAALSWGGPRCSGSLPPPLFLPCILPSPQCNRQGGKHCGSLASWRGGSQPGVKMQQRFNGAGQQVWGPQQALVSPEDAPVGSDSCGWLHSIPAHQSGSPPWVCPAICSQQLGKCFSELIWKAKKLSTNVAAQSYGIKQSRQCAHSRGNCAMGTTVNTSNLFYNSVRQIWNSCSVCSSFPAAMSFSFFTCCKRNWCCCCLQNYLGCTSDF